MATDQLPLFFLRRSYMKNKIWRFLIVITLFSTILACSSNKHDPLQGGEMMFWKVSDEDSAVYLLGSIHFGKAEFYPMPDLINEAYDKSDILGVEVNLLAVDQLALQEVMMQNMYYQDGSKLLDHISPETAELLAEYLESKGMNLEMFAGMKAGALILTISGMEAQMAGLNPQYGIDMHYLIKAQEEGKDIIELESIKSQMEMMFGQEELAEGMLYKTLKDAADYQQMLDSLATIWQAGDALAMKELMTGWDTPEEKLYLDKLFGQRDIEMTEKIEEMLLNNKKAFIILGAGHFVNQEGIINRLADRNKYQIIKY